MSNSENPKVAILMGSDSDLTVMEESRKILAEFGVPCEIKISSAHRTPEETHKFTKEAPGRGIQVMIAGAGHAAHLAGAIAANTTLPVIGVPIDSSALNGLDSLLATVQMPGGMPVATMAIGKSGARNAGLLAVSILALNDTELQQKLTDYRQGLADKVRAANDKLASQ